MLSSQRSNYQGSCLGHHLKPMWKYLYILHGENYYYQCLIHIINPVDFVQLSEHLSESMICSILLSKCWAHEKLVAKFCGCNTKDRAALFVIGCSHSTLALKYERPPDSAISGICRQVRIHASRISLVLS